MQNSPDLAFDGNNYMVAWSDGRTTYYCIYIARVTPSGSVLDPGGIKVGPTVMMSQFNPAIVYTGTRFFIIWVYATSPFAITGRFVNTNGQLISDTLRICKADDKVYGLRIAYCGTNFFITWLEASGPTIKGQLVSGDGSPIGNPFVIASPVGDKSLSSCFDGINFVVTYSIKVGNFYQLWGRKYNENGTPVGPAFQISNSVNDQRHGEIIPGANNHYLNIWSEYRLASRSYDVYANIDIIMTDIDEAKERQSSCTTLKSSVVRDMIRFDGADGKRFYVFDATGRKLGMLQGGCFDCRRLECGVYFIKASSGEAFKVIKIK